MKQIIFAIAFLMSTAAVDAQQTTSAVPAQSPTAQDAMRTEVRALSGKLKETHGQVSQQQTSIEKQLSVATPGATEGLERTKAELIAAKLDLDASLTSVNSATPSTWGEAKARAEAVNEQVLALLARLK